MTLDRPRRGRGRRPATEVRGEILEAAAELLFAEGMGGFTIEKVANLSGASKMTIYKWWPSKGALALDGYFKRVEPVLAFPDTGDMPAPPEPLPVSAEGRVPVAIGALRAGASGQSS